MKKILIVDYDQSSLASLHKIFAGHGYQVITAADGQSGWDKFIRESPDLVLMEAMLPRVHGFELCQRITSEKSCLTVVFIMTGVYKDRVYRTEALRTYGASEYFEKPLKMAELLASVEAVLGKPECRPAAARPAPVEAAAPARPVPEIRPEPAPPAEPLKREKPRSDDSRFALPDDLDKLSRETPKPRRSAPAVRESSSGPTLEALTDKLLKDVLLDAKAAKTVKPRIDGGNGNGNGGGGPDIDQVLKSALAGLEFNKEKIKVPKTAPLPPPPAPEKPVPPPPPVKAAEPKPAPRPVPAPAAPVIPPADAKSILTPGDPGSDVSPFFTPERKKPEIYAPKPVKPAERAEKKPAPPAVTARQQPARPAPPVREPERPKPSAPPAPARDTKSPETRPVTTAGIFQDIVEAKEKKGFPKIIIALVAFAALAAAGFIVLRPKRPAPAPPTTAPATAAPALQTETQSNAPSEPVYEAPKPEPKLETARPKVQPKAKPAETQPAAAQAILPTDPPPAVLPPPGTGPGDIARQAEIQADPGQGSRPAGGTAPPVTETAGNPAQGAGQPAAAPVKEGDLVELAAVTEPPTLVKSVNPVYPPAAQRVGLEGSITVNALIDEKGGVIDTGILKGILDDKGLGKAAETAVRKWKFQPARKDGVAVKVWKPCVISFKAAAPADRNQ